MRYLFSCFSNTNNGDNMKDEIDLLNYLLLNIKMQIDWLGKITLKEHLSENEFEIVESNILVYKKFKKCIEKMINVRVKKGIKETSVLMDVVSSIGAVNTIKKNENIIEVLSESSKINLMDIKRLKDEYNVQSKTILNLLSRLENFEMNNIERISYLIAKK